MTQGGRDKRALDRLPTCRGAGRESGRLRRQVAIQHAGRSGAFDLWSSEHQRAGKIEPAKVQRGGQFQALRIDGIQVAALAQVRLQRHVGNGVLDLVVKKGG